jgi:hypothetical protein
MAALSRDGMNTGFTGRLGLDYRWGWKRVGVAPELAFDFSRWTRIQLNQADPEGTATVFRFLAGLRTDFRVSRLWLWMLFQVGAAKLHQELPGNCMFDYDFCRDAVGLGLGVSAGLELRIGDLVVGPFAGFGFGERLSWTSVGLSVGAGAGAF